MKRLRPLIVSVLAVVLATVQALAALPKPVLQFVGAEQYWVGPVAWVRYEIAVANRDSIDPSLFAAAPNLPPCGAIQNASRLAVAVIDIQNPGAVLHSSCPPSRAELASIRVAFPKGNNPPRYVMLRLFDRSANEGVWSDVFRLTYVERDRVTPPLGTRPPAYVPMPTPVLQFLGTEVGPTHVRYKLAVVNRASFSPALFAPAPTLPPCGTNANASRTWVSIHDAARPEPQIYAFCALGSNDNLRFLWFGVPKGNPAPRSVFIRLTDRLRNETVQSNRVRLDGPTGVGRTARPPVSPN